MRGMFDRIRQDTAQIEYLNRDLEARVRARTAEPASANRDLAHLNMELESFTHVMAHDLRTALRAQEGFSRMLLDDVRDLMKVGRATASASTWRMRGRCSSLSGGW